MSSVLKFLGVCALLFACLVLYLRHRNRKD